MTVEQKPGKFIVIEGNDGAGKTTQVARLAEYFRKLGFDVVATREPGGIKETEALRALILDPRLAEDGLGQLLLFVADRRIHLLFEVVPALKQGKIVISDRFSGSTEVYQSFDRGVDRGYVTLLDKLARQDMGGQREFLPDLVILLDISPEVGMARRQGMEEKTYFDKDDVYSQRKRRAAYYFLAQDYGWEIIDGGLSEEEVFSNILTVLKGRGILP